MGHWGIGRGAGRGGGFDADAIIRVEDVGADQKDLLAGLSSLSLSHPFPVGLLPMSGRSKSVGVTFGRAHAYEQWPAVA